MIDRFGERVILFTQFEWIKLVYGLNRVEVYIFFKEAYCAWILIKNARFPALGLDITGISSKSNGDICFFQKGLLCLDSDRGRSIFPVRS